MSEEIANLIKEVHSALDELESALQNIVASQSKVITVDKWNKVNTDLPQYDPEGAA